MKTQTPLSNPVKSLTNIIKPAADTHIWQFARVGGVNRVNLVSGNDLKSLEQLDQKLWTALSCPVSGLEIDSRTLKLIDADGDLRIRVPEIIEAAKWITSLIKNPDDLLKANKTLPLSAINDDTSEGKELLASAKQILLNLGKQDKSEIGVEETSDTASIFANTRFNGDGIITPESASDESVKKLINSILSCVAPVTDRNGKPGITEENIIDFYQWCKDFSEWYSLAEVKSANILLFGEKTGEAFNAFLAVRSKIDDYFLRCRLSDYDPSST